MFALTNIRRREYDHWVTHLTKAQQAQREGRRRVFVAGYAACAKVIGESLFRGIVSVTQTPQFLEYAERAFDEYEFQAFVERNT